MKILGIVAAILLTACTTREGWVPTVTVYPTPSYVDPYAPSNYAQYERVTPQSIGRCRLFGCIVNDRSLMCACIDKNVPTEQNVVVVPDKSVIIGADSSKE